MGSNPVTVILPGIEPLSLHAAQVCPHVITQKRENQLHAIQNATVYIHDDCNSFFVLQASDQFFTFDRENISVSIGSPEEERMLSLSLGIRQTLLIPSNITDEWLLVSQKHKIIKINYTKGLLVVT